MLRATLPFPRLGSSVTEPIASELIVELRPFIVDTDLHDLPLALNVVTLLLLLQPSVKGSIETQILPQVLALTRSPVLIGAPLEAVSSFFSGLVGADPDLALKLIPELTKLSSADKTIPDSTSGGLQAYRTVSQCVGVIVTASQRNSAGVIAELSRVITVGQASNVSQDARTQADDISHPFQFHSRVTRLSPRSSYLCSRSARLDAPCTLFKSPQVPSTCGLHLPSFFLCQRHV